MAVVAAPAVAGPVTADASEAAQAASAAGLSAAPLATPGLLTGVAEPSPAAPDAAASASALAAELIREAEAGAAATEAAPQPSRSVRQASTQQKAAPTPAKALPKGGAAEGDDWELREMGRSALDWLKDKVPWLRSEDDQRVAGGDASAIAPDWAPSSLEGNNLGQTGLTGMPQAPGVNLLGSPNAGSPGWQEPGRRDKTELDRNLVREAIQFIREVLEHPMTWLVISLFVVGGLVMSKMDRRPK